MSGYTKFAVVGAGRIGSCIVQELLKEKANGTIKEVIVLTRQVKYPSYDQVVHDILSTSLAVDTKGSEKTIQGDVKVVEVDYSNDESIKNALTGVDVVISTVAIAALNIQGKVAAAAKNADVKLFVPSEFGNISEGDTEGLHGTKTNIQRQLIALGLPFVAIYTGKFPDSGWTSYVLCYPSLFVYSVPLTIGLKVHKSRYRERKGVRWRRRQHAAHVHVQTRCRPICFICLDAPSSCTTQEPFLRHRW
jgi:NmrA-like family